MRQAHLGFIPSYEQDDEYVEFIEGADLNRANLSGADLRGAYLDHTSLRYTNLTKANLCRANLENADLNHADLTGADLRGVKLLEADLGNADLTGADLTNAQLSIYTEWGENALAANLSRADLTDVTGISIEELEMRAGSLKGAIMPDGTKHP